MPPPVAKVERPGSATASAARVKAPASPVGPFKIRRCPPSSAMIEAVTPAPLALIAPASPSRLLFAASMVIVLATPPTVRVHVPAPIEAVLGAHTTQPHVCAR